MKGILLCAGRGTRMQPFTFSMPKPLLPVVNRPLLDHGIDKFREAGIHEIGIVIHPAQRAIVDHVTNVYRDQKIQVLVQKEPLGIAHALRSVQSFIGQEPFVLLLGDNLLAGPLHKLVQSSEGGKSSLLLKRVSNPQEFGVALVDRKQGHIVELEEKPSVPKSDLAVMGAYVFQPAIFEAINAIPPSGRGEYEITDAIQWLVDHDHSVTYLETLLPIFDVGTHSRWLEANTWMMAEQGREEVSIGRNTRIEGCVFLGNVRVGDDCLLENAVIGPNVTIQDGCLVQECRIENSILLTGATVSTRQAVRESILGRGAILKGEEATKGVIRCMLGDKSVYQLCESEADQDT
jgi:glucose-1-phosphate thymidylyltransferase